MENERELIWVVRSGGASGSLRCAVLLKTSSDKGSIPKPHFFLLQLNLTRRGHHRLSGKSDENKSFSPNQSVHSIYFKIELCYFSLDQWEIRIHLLWGKCFNIPHHCDPHLNQTKFNDLLPLTIPGVLSTKVPRGANNTETTISHIHVYKDYENLNGRDDIADFAYSSEMTDPPQ